MWFLVVFVVALLLVSALTPKPNIENARSAKLGDFQFPRSKHGDPMPLVWGTVRQKSPIVAWYGDFVPVAITEKVKTGLTSSTRVTVGYKNYMGIDCILCLGPNVTLRKIWADTEKIWEGSLSSGDITINLPQLFGGEKEGGGLQGTMTFYNGDFNPPQDPYLVTKIGPEVPAYNGFARAVFKSFYIGTSTTPKAFSFELSRFSSGLHPTYSLMPNGYDVNPMEVIYDAFTQKWGRFGNLPSELDLDSFLSCAKTLYDEEMGISLIVQSAITGKDVLEEVMRVADGVLYQDPATSKIVAKLIRQDYIVADLPTFDESSISSLKNFQKTTWENTFNQCRVTFKDRANNYDDSVAITQDFANINFQNRVKSTEINVPGCSVAAVASRLAARQLSLLNVPLYKCDIVVNRKAQNLRPGSVFVLNWKPFNVSGMVMRVTKIDFGELTSNEIKISCVQDRFSSSTVTFSPPEGSNWTPTNTAAQNVVNRLLFTPPAFLSSNNTAETASTFDSNGRLYCLAVAPGTASVSYDGMFSLDNFATEPTTALKDASYNGGGLLLNPYPATIAATSRYDTSSTFVVTGVAPSAVQKLAQYTTLEQARDGSALLMVNNELFVYVGYVDNGNGQVTFPRIYRSVLDTVPAGHASNDRVWFISSADGLIPSLLPVGTAGYAKLLDRTTSAALPINSATAFSATLTNRAGLPLPPCYLTLAGSRTPSPQTGAESIVVAWRNRSRGDTLLRVYDDATNTREAGTQTRIRWRVGTGAYTAVTTTSNTVTLDVKKLVGTLQVIVDSQIIANGKYSSGSDTLTMQLN